MLRWLTRLFSLFAERGAAVRKPVVEEIEPRILYSADANPLLWGGIDPNGTAIVAGIDGSNSSSTPQPVDAQQQRLREIVFVDSSVIDAQTLLDGLIAGRPQGISIEVVQLDPAADGLQQINAVLANERDLGAVHIVSHGDDAVLHLGSTRLDEQALAQRGEELNAWRNALGANADVLLYGCDVGAGDTGAAFIDRLAQLTGADVAASTDATGATALGGNWVLEAQTGHIEVQLNAVARQLEQSWSGLLSLTPQGGETLINSGGTAGNQNTTPYGGGNVAMDASGNYVVVFVNNAVNSGDIYAQRYNAAGVAQGSAMLVNSTTTDVQREPSVAMAADGRFVVSWSSNTQDGSGYGIYVRAFAADGTPATAAFLVNTSTTGNQVLSKVGMDNAGNFIVTFTDYNVNSGDVYAQRYNAAGVAQGSNFRVNTTVGNLQGFPDIDVHASSGDFLIVWESNLQDGSGNGVYGQRYNAAGVALGGEFQLHTTTANMQESAKVAYAADGSFAVAWESGSSNIDFIVRRFDANGVALTGEIVASNYTANTQRWGDLAFRDNNNLIVTWQSDIQDGSGWGVYAQQFDAATGAKLGAEIRVSTSTTNAQQYPSLAVSGARAVIVWEGNGTVGGQTDSAGVFAQRFNVNGITVTPTSGHVTTEAGGTAQFSVVLDSAPTANVTIAVSSSDTTEGTVSTSSLVFTSANWNVAQTVTVTGVNDTLDDGNIAFNIVTGAAVSSDAAYSGLAVSDVAVSNTDDDTYSTVVVTNTTDTVNGSTASIAALMANDGGDGISLREAIIAANNTANGSAADRITFAIAGTGTHAVNVASALPEITDAVVIDATTDDSFAANGNRPAIILDGNNLAGNGLVLSATAGGSTIRGLVVRDFGGNGIQIDAGANGNTIAGNYIGSLLADGNTAGAAEANGQAVVVMSANNTIGGLTAADRNVLSGNSNGVLIRGAAATGNLVVGNYIGTGATGAVALGNSFDGVRIEMGAAGNTVGGVTTNHRNVISGNGNDAIQIDGETSDGNIIQGNILGLNAAATAALASGGNGVLITAGADNTVIGGATVGAANQIGGFSQRGIGVAGVSSGTLIQGNSIGTDASGAVVAGNAFEGVLLDIGAFNNTVGGTAAGTGNLIANNAYAGVAIAPGALVGNAILGNSITGNTGLGIDLGWDSVVAANDGGDGDTGANNQQNFPVLTTARSNASNQLVLTGTLNSTANSFYRIEFFANASQDGTGYGEGQTYLGFATVATDGSGNATISATLVANVSEGSFISATATRSDAAFTNFTDTSEFARNIVAISSTQATVTVTTASDISDGDTTSLSTLLANRGADGFISLREAVTAANNTANGTGGADRIVFNIAGTGLHTITLSSLLPTISGAVVIDASTDDSFAANGNRPAIVIDGNNVAGNGLTLAAGASGSTVRGLVIRDMTGHGIEIQAGSSGNLIAGNYIGRLEATGLGAVAGEANTQSGLYIAGSNNVIGGSTAADRNVVSGNGAANLVIEGSANAVRGNYIGTNAAGTGDVDGTATQLNRSGVRLQGNAAGNVIGGTSAGERNVISGNNHVGVDITGLGVRDTLVLGNYIGTDASGLVALPNAWQGLSFWGAGTGNRVGSGQAGGGNVIVGTAGREAVHIGNGSQSAVIQGNLIGLGADGSTVLGAGGVGVSIPDNSGNNTLIGTDGDGSNDAGERNVISGNVIGVQIGALNSGTVVAGNYIGTDASGTLNRGNTAQGVLINANAGASLIGGAGAAQGNLIAYNGSAGVAVTNTSGHAVIGNQLYGNGALAIDLGNDGLTANDASDGDAGANNQQNFPVLASAATTGTQVTIIGSLDSAANSYYRIEFFANTSGDASGHGEGQTYLGFANVATDGSGNATFSATLTQVVPAGAVISATATTSNTAFTTFTDTSEFAANVVAFTNAAPVLDASQSPALAAINEDAGAPVGAVGSLVSALVDFASPAGQVDNVTDADSGAQPGIAVTAADTSNGAWWISTDNGANWIALGAVSNTNARLLAADANTRLYFQPNANYNGTTTSAITLRAWDRTSGVNGGTANTSTNGGASAFSAATDTASLTVTAVNDAPSGAPVVTGTATEDQTLTANTSSIADADGLGAFSYQWQRNGVAIAGATGSTYTLGDAEVGATIRVVVSYTDGNASAESLTSAAVGPVANVNDAPSGAPVVAGTATEDQTLTANTSSIADADALGVFSYQWQRNGGSIAGATGSTYLLGDADVGANMRVVVSWTDGNGTAESLTSVAVGPVANVNDAPTGAVVVSGTPTEDQTLTANTASIADADGLGAFSYQWQRNGVAIAGGTSSTYTLGDADVGTNVRVVVSYTDARGTAESLSSVAVGPIANVNDAPTGSVTIDDTTPTQGQTIVASNTLADADGLGLITYTWQADGATVGTGNTYIVTEAEVGKVISVVASYTDGHGTSESVSSAATAAVANVNDAPTGAPVVSGTPTEDQTLTADTSTIADADGLGTFSYQWQRNGVAIAGATAASYTLGDADVGTNTRVIVNYTDANGSPESLTSAVVGPIANANDAPSGAPAVTGTPTEDQTLSADTSAIADIDGLGAFGYQWQRNGVNIAGATASTYTLGDADVGMSIRVVVSYIDGNGTAESRTSAAVGPVANVNDAPSGASVVTGTATEDQTLMADTASIADADGLGVFSYQWQRNGVAVGGATASTYALGDADVGTNVRVVVSYTDGHGAAESLTSASVGPAANVNDAPSGAPVVTGAATEDQTLSADTTSIADADGLGAFLYQWQRNGANVVGATASTYTLGDADVGTSIRVVVSYTDGNGTAESLTSATAGPVANVNDAPAITSDGGTAMAAVGVAENRTAVTTVTSSDVDGGVPAYTIIGGADAARFAIDAASGALRFASAPDFEAPSDADFDNIYRLVVGVDDGNGGVATQAIAVAVSGINEAPGSIAPAAALLTEQASAGTVVAIVTASDPDAGDLFTFTLINDGNGRFVIDPSSGRLTVAAGAVLDFESAPSHTLLLRVTDSQGLRTEQQIVVSLRDVSEALPETVLPTTPTPPLPPAVVLEPVPAPTLPLPAINLVPATERESAGDRDAPDAPASPGLVGTARAGAPRQEEGAESARRTYGRPLSDDAPLVVASVSFNVGGPAAGGWDDAVLNRLLMQQGGDSQAPRFGWVSLRGPAVDTDAGDEASARGRSAQQALTAAVQDPVRVASATLTAGFVWWLTRSGGLLTSILMGVPAWRHVDLLPVLAPANDDEEQAEGDSRSDGAEPSQRDSQIDDMFSNTSRMFGESRFLQ